MPYAHNGQISQDPIEGGIEITQEQYRQAIAGMLEGLEVTIEGGFNVAPPPEPPAPEPPSLVDRQAAKWEAIKAERERRTRNGGYLVGDKWFHSDPDSRIQQIGLVMMGASIPEGLQWKAMDGSMVAMTQTLANQIFAAAAVSDQAIFAKAEEHNAAMLASPTPETYDHLTGWPKVYGE